MDSGSQGRENAGVSNLISGAAPVPVAAGAPAILPGSPDTGKITRKRSAVKSRGCHIHLTVWLKDGRKLTGTFPYLCALARLDTASALPNFKDAHMEAA